MFKLANLLPREEKFYRFLEDLCIQAQNSAHHLKAFINAPDATERAAAAAAIVSSKAQAKTIASTVTRELCLTFVTPFDREDIQNFAGTLYKITKTIDKVRAYLEMYHLEDFADLSGQIDVILAEAAAMESVLHALVQGGKTKQILEQAALLDKLEQQGDDVLSALLVQLINNTQDARQLILKKDLYDMLERVIDRYRDAADIALQIALKHS